MELEQQKRAERESNSVPTDAIDVEKIISNLKDSLSLDKAKKHHANEPVIILF